MTIQVDVDKIVPLPSGLRFGLVVRYGDGGPVRFVQASCDWSMFTVDVQAAVVKAFNDMLDAEPEGDPLF